MTRDHYDNKTIKFEQEQDLYRDRHAVSAKSKFCKLLDRLRVSIVVIVGRRCILSLENVGLVAGLEALYCFTWTSTNALEIRVKAIPNRRLTGSNLSIALYLILAVPQLTAAFTACGMLATELKIFGGR